MGEAVTPPADRLAEIARAGSIELTSTGAAPELGPPGTKTLYVMIRAENRDWLLAELARVTAERDALRKALGDLALAAAEQPRPTPELTNARHAAWTLIYGASGE